MRKSRTKHFRITFARRGLGSERRTANVIPHFLGDHISHSRDRGAGTFYKFCESSGFFAFAHRRGQGRSREVPQRIVGDLCASEGVGLHHPVEIPSAVRRCLGSPKSVCCGAITTNSEANSSLGSDGGSARPPGVQFFEPPPGVSV
jgi:hypothetical protein